MTGVVGFRMPRLFEGTVIFADYCQGVRYVVLKRLRPSYLD